jgi:hypothetical protein
MAEVLMSTILKILATALLTAAFAVKMAPPPPPPAEPPAAMEQEAPTSEER